MATRDRRTIYALAALGGVALVTKLVPLLRFGPFAYGHDSGFYRRYLIEPFLSFPNTPVPGLDHTVFIPRMVLDIVRFVIHQPNIVLYGTYIVFSLIGAACVWYLAAEYLSQRTAFYATALYVLSGIQFLAYENFFFKEAVALPLFLLTIVFLEREWYARAAILGVAVILTQQTSSILLIGVVGLGFLCRAAMVRKVSIGHVFSGTVMLAAYLMLHPHVAQKVASPPVGIFMTQASYLLWSAPLLILVVLGLRRFIPAARHKPMLAAALIVPLAFAVLHLPFYNRIYVFLDMFLILPAAFGVEVIRDFVSSRSRKAAVPAVILVFLIAAVPLIRFEYMQAPAIPIEAQESLSALATLPKGSAVITSPALLPWVQGWSLSSVYAPGNLKEPHSISEWSLYWLHADPRTDREFLSTFPRPLYVFAGAHEASYRPACATSVNTYLSSADTCIK